MAFKDRDEFLDDLYNFIFDGEEEPNDEDNKWFEEKVGKYFEELEKKNTSNGDNNSGGNGSSRRRRTNSNGSAPPRRQRRQTAGTGGSSGYGLGSWWGNNQ